MLYLVSADPTTNKETKPFLFLIALFFVLNTWIKYVLPLASLKRNAWCLERTLFFPTKMHLLDSFSSVLSFDSEFKPLKSRLQLPEWPETLHIIRVSVIPGKQLHTKTVPGYGWFSISRGGDRLQYKQRSRVRVLFIPVFRSLKP